MLHSIALSSNDPESCDLIITFIWDVLKERSDKKWRRIEKTMTLTEMILKHGSDQIIDLIRRDLWRVQQWREYRVMEGQKEVGGGIRHKAAGIADLIADSQQLEVERQKAWQLSERMTSM